MSALTPRDRLTVEKTMELAAAIGELTGQRDEARRQLSHARQEARAALLAELRAKVEALPRMYCGPEEVIEDAEYGDLLDRAAVLEAMEAMQRALGS